MAVGTAFINPIPIGDSTSWWYVQADTYPGTPVQYQTYPKCRDRSCTSCYPNGTVDETSNEKDKMIVIRDHQIALLNREIERLKDKERDISEVFQEVEMMKDTCKNCKALIKLKK